MAPDADGDGIPDDLDPCDGDPVAPEGQADDDEVSELRVLFPRPEDAEDQAYLAELRELAGDS